MTTEMHAASGTPAGFPTTARLVDGGDMECASGLLLLITRSMRRPQDGELLTIRSAEPSVQVDLPAWAEMVGNDVAGRAEESAAGPWWFACTTPSAAGSWARAMDGIARGLGFQVRVAATMFLEDPEGVAALHARPDQEGIAAEDRVIRPVAQEGFAESAVHVSLESLAPEPVITSDGAWWHPVAVTYPNMRIADAPLPLSEVFGVVQDILDVQSAASALGREVFRCA